MRRLVLSFLLLVLWGCSPSPPATFPDKLQSAMDYNGKWGRRDWSFQNYGMTRSVQLVDVEDFRRGDPEKLERGLATLISEDGYALTASHVAEQGDAVGVLLYFENEQPTGVVHLTMTRDPLALGYAQLSHAGDGSKSETPKLVKITRKPLVIPIRMVHKFKGVDLSLIKIPGNYRYYFDAFDEEREVGDVGFLSGSLLSEASGAAAGELTSFRLKGNEVWEIEGKIPQGPGDSGGPIFNRRGDLLGITFARQARRKGGEKFPRGLFLLPKTGVLKELLREDRLVSREGR